MNQDENSLNKELNIDLKTLAKFFGVKKSCFANWVLEYDIQKPKSESVKIGIKTNLKKYGVRIQFKRVIIQEKIKATTLRKYGTTHISQSKYYKERMQKQRADINEKIFATKRKRGTIGNKSKQEDVIYDKLKMKFPTILRQYKSEEYPFLCDFYIPDLKLYIEFQGCWTHGFKPFLNTKDDKKKLNILKEKDANFTGADVRNGIAAVISIKHPDPRFEGQTKTKLDNQDASKVVAKVTGEEMYKEKVKIK